MDALPQEILEHILRFLDPDELQRFLMTCKTYYAMWCYEEDGECQEDDEFWDRVCTQPLDDYDRGCPPSYKHILKLNERQDTFRALQKNMNPGMGESSKNYYEYYLAFDNPIGSVVRIPWREGDKIQANYNLKTEEYIIDREVFYLPTNVWIVCKRRKHLRHSYDGWLAKAYYEPRMYRVFLDKNYDNKAEAKKICISLGSDNDIKNNLTDNMFKIIQYEDTKYVLVRAFDPRWAPTIYKNGYKYVVLDIDDLDLVLDHKLMLYYADGRICAYLDCRGYYDDTLINNIMRKKTNVWRACVKYKTLNGLDCRRDNINILDTRYDRRHHTMFPKPKSES